MSTYVYIDISSKQEFIYNSNKLAENLNRSLIVKLLTEESRNSIDEIPIVLSRFLEGNFGVYDFVFSGGGNSIVKFKEVSDAIKFIEEYSRTVIVKYPEIELYMSRVNDEEALEVKYKYKHRYKDKEKDEIIRELLIEKVSKIKDTRRSRFRRWTYGVEKINEFGKGKLYEDKKSMPQGASGNKAISRNYLREKIEAKTEGAKIKFVADLNDYKRNEGYIGVISIDGNKMGEMVKEISCFSELKELGKEIEDIYLESIIESCKEITDEIKKTKDLKEEEKVLMITPIVLAGDDISLIVDAKYAIEISNKIIKNIKEKSEQHKKKNKILKKAMGTTDYLTACGGVVIVKPSYPFFEAIIFAEALCKNAKEFSCKVKENASFLTWQISRGSILKDTKHLEKIKRKNDDEQFTIKPLRIDKSESIEDVFSYDGFKNMVKTIKRSSISSAGLHSIRKQFYSGIDNYEIFINEKARKEEFGDSFKLIDSKIAEVLNRGEVTNDSKIDKTNIINGVLKSGNKNIYVLNDIIDAYNFIWSDEDGK